MSSFLVPFQKIVNLLLLRSILRVGCEFFFAFLLRSFQKLPQKNHKAIKARRAGIFVIKLLLEGLGDDAFGVLQGTIRDIWKSLIAQQNSEPDEIMQVHILQPVNLRSQILS